MTENQNINNLFTFHILNPSDFGIMSYGIELIRKTGDVKGGSHEMQKASVIKGRRYCSYCILYIYFRNHNICFGIVFKRLTDIAWLAMIAELSLVLALA